MLDFIAGNDLLSAIVAFALILIPAILIHELGHFLAAKAIGITVIEFGLGLPPRIGKLFTWGETEFTLNLLPMGGFVRPLGEDLVGPVTEEKAKRDRDRLEATFDESDHEEDLDPESPYVGERDELRSRGVLKMMSVNEARPLPRIFFMAAGALANFGMAIILFIAVALFGLREEIGGRVLLVDVPPESEFARAGAQPGDAIELINGEFFTGFESFMDYMREFENETVTFTMLNTDSGENFDITIAPNADTLTSYVLIAGIAEDSPAHLAGLLPGDLIVAINGIPLTTDEYPVNDLVRASKEFAGKNMELSIWRMDEENSFEMLEIVLVPRVDPPEGEGSIGVLVRPQFSITDGVRFLDAPPQEAYIPRPLGESISYGFSRTAETFDLILSIPGRIVRGSLSPKEARPVSIIGISQIGGKFLQQSIQDGHPSVILNFIALINIFLGVTNLLPLPALDGGRILFVLIEILRGKPVSPEREGTIHRWGIIILLGLGALIMLYDLFNPFSL